MAALQLLEVATLLAYCHGGAHFDLKLAAREQVRGALINTPPLTDASGKASLTQPNLANFANIVMPSAQGHATFGSNQDLLLRYQPRFLDTLRYTLPATVLQNGQRVRLPGQATWTPLAIMHRMLLTYKAGEEHALAFNGQFNLQIGKQDTGDPGNLDTADPSNVSDSGFLPGRLGTLFDYTSVMGIFKFTHRPSRHIRLSTQETVGFMQYRTSQALAYFDNMPNVQGGAGAGIEKQLRLYMRGELEYLFDSRSSLFADVDVTDVSYQQTASFPAFAPSVGYGTSYAGPGQLRVQAGFIKYWVNPMPGIFEKPGYLPTLTFTLAQSFAPLGLPKLTGNVVLGLAPYYNIIFSGLEPRSTATVQLTYGVSRALSLMVTARALSSRFYNLRRWNSLQRGHQRNYVLASLGVRYNWRNILELNLSAYGSTQSYQRSSTMQYTQMRSIYVTSYLQGTWQGR